MRGAFARLANLKLCRPLPTFQFNCFSLYKHIFKTFADLCRPKMPLLTYCRHLPAFVTFEFGVLFQPTIAKPCGGFAALCQVSQSCQPQQLPCRQFPTQRTRPFESFAGLLQLENPKLCRPFPIKQPHTSAPFVKALPALLIFADFFIEH
jgi:hypothetical protein